MNTSFALSAFQWRGVWGERTNPTPGRGYCANIGHPEDETGLVYMRARHYKPATGRFISEDPARDGVNWYLYADGDPVGKVDASGSSSNAEQFLRNLAALLLSPYFPLKLMVAIGTACAGMSAIFALSARFNSGGKGVPKDDVDALVFSVAFAGVATICFGFASIGLEGSREALAAMINAVVSLINTLAQIVAICGGSVRAGGGWGFVCGTAMFMYGLYLFGALAASEAEQNMGS
jgi:RHS repeat-associated protein